MARSSAARLSRQRTYGRRRRLPAALPRQLRALQLQGGLALPRPGAWQLPRLGLPRIPSLPLGRRLPGRLPGNSRARSMVLAALAALMLLGAFWFWFRGSTFTSVERVRVSGVSGPDAAAIESALGRAARGMHTLDYSLGGLRAAVASYPQVRTLTVSTSFPHGMRIMVSEQLPAAVLVSDSGARTAAAGDGVVLGSRLAATSLPTVSVTALPQRRVHEAQTLAYLTVLGAAPTPLAGFITRAYNGPKGLTVALRNGLLVYFGDDTGARAKWLAFARALLAADTSEAVYVDVRAPERPAVGDSASAGVAAGGGSSQAAGATAGTGGGEAALIAGLQATVGGESGLPGATPSGAGTEPQSEGSTGSGEATGEGPEEAQAPTEGSSGTSPVPAGQGGG